MMLWHLRSDFRRPTQNSPNVLDIRAIFVEWYCDQENPKSPAFYRAQVWDKSHRLEEEA